jgi:hypothetical protein
MNASARHAAKSLSLAERGVNDLDDLRLAVDFAHTQSPLGR